MQAWGVVLAAIAYVLFLFLVASYGDRQRKELGFQRSGPAIYALSLAIYCTSWTFFGSVGLAATSGLDFLAIYVGPILVVTLAFPIFSHVIRVAKSERITSIADFLASRYGKSTATGAVAAGIAAVGTVPYIALQLKAISSSVETMVRQYQPLQFTSETPVDTAFFVSMLLAVFAVLFGTRHADATEHQGGLMLAVATESIIKLVAFLAVGLFVTFHLFGGIGDIVEQARTSTYVNNTFNGSINPGTFAVFTLLSFCAFLMLPRQFHVGIVENHSEQEAKTARWMFPLYLVLINLFVVPVALAGMLKFGSSIDPDTFVLALPINADAPVITMIVFIGGLSAATAMVIVACVALAIMLSNNIVLPLVLRQRESFAVSGRDMAPVLLVIRRTSIFLILALAYAYFKVAGDTAALASIGLLSFAAIAQFAPAFFAGMFWRAANQRGALFGMIGGFATWFYTLLLPTLLDGQSSLMMNGPLGIEWLRPQALLGLDAAPLTHGVFFSLSINLLLLIGVSMSREARPIERMQANAFWYYGRHSVSAMALEGQSITIGDLQAEVANYLGTERGERAFERYALQSGIALDRRELAGDDLMHFAEQLLASAIGAASSRLVMSLMLEKHGQSTGNALQLLGDASEALQHNRGMLQTAIDQVEQGISVFDAEFRLSSWNRPFRELLELPKALGEAGTPLSDITLEVAKGWHWDREGEIDFAKQLLDTQTPWQITQKDTGNVIEVHTKPLPVGGYVISWHDITERVLAAQALQTANETLEKRVLERTQELTRLNDDLALAREAAEAANIGKTKFIAAVGHDILQPLNAARLYASTLREKLNGEPTQNLAQNVDVSLESVEDIMSAVLAISRLDAGALIPNKTSFSVAGLFDRLKVEFQPIAEAKGLELVVRSNQLAVQSDFNLLRRVLQNLISNSIKYTQKGTVTLDAKLKRNKVVFTVSDTGQGMSAKEQSLAFEEFKRLDAGVAVASGLGLGLSIVKRLAVTLEHPLSLSSRTNHGSTFSIEVPLAVDVVEIRKDVPSGKSEFAHLDGLKVVCVDNEPRILDGMRELLGGWGCHVTCYENGDDVLKNLHKDKPRLLLADYHIDKQTGLDVIESARQTQPNDFVAVLITADRSSAVRQACKSADVHLLNKPLKPAALRALLSLGMNTGRKKSTSVAVKNIEPAE